MPENLNANFFDAADLTSTSALSQTTEFEYSTVISQHIPILMNCQKQLRKDF
jgi:hypothetical protein